MLPARTGVRWLLWAAVTMTVETSCSHAPQEQVPVDIWKPRAYQELQRHEGEGQVFRIYTTQDQVVATSRYTLTDSSVVIQELLMDGKYYESTGEAAIPQVVVPFEIGVDRLAAVDRWEPPHTTRNALAYFGVGIVAFAAIGAIIWGTILASIGD